MENDQVMIHVRFAPDGTIAAISERPDTLSDQGWFNLLASSTTDCYETLSGARALFRLPKLQVDQLKSSAA
ncbi:hypothetical protein [Thiobacillus sp.]|uniref:hypothetical protein n=1 Tax=Thiobacillus sp. TaxID=924 RepID=UPI00286DDBED|nr:hypothetical protein [Thiobacillus sp.]